jgi:hypothetical protein
VRARLQAGGAARAALVAVVTAVVGLGVLVALAVSLPLAFEEEPVAAAITRPATQAEATAALEAAAAALRAGDEDAWRAALPASGAAARRASADLFRTLGHLPWTALEPVVEAVPAKPGDFDVRFVGELAGIGPADRLLADRVLRLEVLGDRVVATGDDTPPQARRQYFMAYRAPRLVEGQTYAVLTEPAYESVAEDLVAADATARSKLAVLGIHPDRRVLVYLYASHRQMQSALNGGPSDERFQTFSAPVQRYPEATWWPRDIHIVASAVEGQQDAMPRLLAHELTHEFTVRWFAKTENDPMFLAEGLAVAVAGGRSYAPLREELAAGNRRLPLATAIALGSLWSGQTDDVVTIGYLEAGSVVLYVLDEWGLSSVKAWVTAVADSDLTRPGIEVATRTTLGVSWGEFVAGWSAYVETLP